MHRNKSLMQRFMKRFENFLWLSQQCSSHHGQQALMFLLVLVSDLLVYGEPLILKQLIDDGTRHFSPFRILAFCFLLLLCNSLRTYLRNLADHISFAIDHSLIERLRLKVLRHMTQLDGHYHARTSQGEKLFLFEVCVPETIRLGAEAGVTLLSTAFTFLGAFLLLYRLDRSLAVYLLPLALLSPLIAVKFNKRLVRQTSQLDKQREEAFRAYEEQVYNSFSVQLLSAEKLQEQTVIQSWRRQRAFGLRKQKTELQHRFASNAVASVTVLTIFAYGFYQVHVGSATIGSVVAFYGCAYRLFQPLLQLVTIYSNVVQVDTHLSQLRRFLGRNSALALGRGEENSTIPEATSDTEVCTVRELQYCIRGGAFAIKARELTFARASYTAVTGLSGSGKSTLAQLLSHILVPDSGEVYLNRRPMRLYAPERLRSQVRLITQQILLFNASVRANILLGYNDISQDEFERAVKAAEIPVLLKDRGRRIGPNGCDLSGGERQRVALARVLIRCPQVLILDEATNALDETSEKLIYRNLKKYYPTLTVIAVTHRLGTLDWADAIICVDEGNISIKHAKA